jgi:hypothetical protein
MIEGNKLNHKGEKGYMKTKTYYSFDEIGQDLFGLKPFKRVTNDKQKLASQQEKFLGTCPFCKQPLHYVFGTNVLACNNEKCKGKKFVTKTLTVRKLLNIDHFLECFPKKVLRLDKLFLRSKRMKTEKINIGDFVRQVSKKSGYAQRDIAEVLNVASEIAAKNVGENKSTVIMKGIILYPGYYPAVDKKDVNGKDVHFGEVIYPRARFTEYFKNNMLFS